MQTPLQRARERANVTQAELADALGLSQPRVSDFERNPIENRPDPDTAVAIIKFFHDRGVRSLTELQVMYPERYMERRA